MTDSETVDSTEFTRLSRETPWGVEIGCSLMTGLVCLVIGGVLGWLGFHGPGMNWIELAVVFGFGGTGVIAMLLVVHQSIARRVPETIVEVAPSPMRTGVPNAVRIIQHGPVRLRSLRGKVVWLETDGNSGRHIVLEETFFEKRHVQVDDSWETVATLTLPENALPTGRHGGKKNEWRIEIRGRVRFFPDFLHPFEVRVKRGDDE